MSGEKLYNIPDATRRLMLTIIADDIKRIDEYAILLQYLFEHMPRAKCEAALKWLVQNKITGRNFLGFFFVEAKESTLELIRILTAKIEREKNLRPLFIGKDVI